LGWSKKGATIQVTSDFCNADQAFSGLTQWHISRLLIYLSAMKVKEYFFAPFNYPANYPANSQAAGV
jgi:hypothetical protein